MSVVVTGATGQLGRHIVESLLDRGVDPAAITATGRNTARLADLADRGVRTAALSYDTPDQEVFQEGDTLMLVSSSEVGQRARQHAAVIEAAVAAGVSRIVYTSLLGGGESGHALAPEHGQTETLLAGTGLPVTILRNGWYHENQQPNFDQAAERGSFIGSSHAGRISGAARTDYAEAAAVVLTTDGHEGKVYELAGDQALTADEIAAVFGAALGTDVSYVDLDTAAHAAALVQAGLDEGTAGFVAGFDTNTADGLLESGATDLADLIGRPATPLADLAAQWAAERGHRAQS